MLRTEIQLPTAQIGCVSHTYTLNLLHVVFSTKNRAPLIHNLEPLIKNLRGIDRNKNIDVSCDVAADAAQANTGRPPGADAPDSHHPALRA